MRIIVLLIPALLCAQAPPGSTRDDPVLHWMDQIAQRQLDRRDKEIAAIKTKADAQRRQQMVRAKILELIGGMPDYHGPLNVRVTGQLKNSSYTIEKVIYESLPHYFITADLYRPNAPGRYPAVLMSNGHNMWGKVENHVMAANLAAKGFIALSYDPVGQGERMQTYDPMIGKNVAGCCTNEHLHAGAQSILIGESVARYFIWDAMRSIDYLVSRPDVDADRIGAAGCSGGGCLTTYITMLDSRIKAGAPACFINSLRVLFAGPYPDSEMSLPGFLAAGLDHADFLEMVAPKPWLVLATENDFFTPAGAKMVYDEAKKWYALYDAEDKVSYFVGPGPHGTPLETRERMYAFMIRWLKDGKGDPREHGVPYYTDRDLQVTKSGQVEYEPGSRKLYEIIRDEFHARRQPQGVPELMAELGHLGIASDRRAPALRTLDEKSDATSRSIHIRLEVEPNVEVNAVLRLPRASGRKPALIIVKDRYTPELSDLATAKGIIVLELEPRDAPHEHDNRVFLGDWLNNTRANSIGLNLPALRAHDVLKALDYLASRDDVRPDTIRATAHGEKGIWLLLAAAVDPRLGKIWIDRTPHSFSSALDAPLFTNPWDAAIPGFLLHWDLPDLVAAAGKQRVLWTDPANWMNQVQGLGDAYRYRYSEQPDDDFLAELFR